MAGPDPHVSVASNHFSAMPAVMDTFLLALMRGGSSWGVAAAGDATSVTRISPVIAGPPLRTP
jgi:hypothetical protein